jgi:uncharacterized membrane protein
MRTSVGLTASPGCASGRRQIGARLRRLGRDHRSFVVRLRRVGLAAPSSLSREQTIPPSRKARLLLVVVVLAYLSFYLTWTLQNRARFSFLSFDLGIHDQAAWLLSQGRSFSTIMGRPYYGDHLYFVMLPVVLLYWLGGGANALIVLQVLAFGLAAVPAFLMVREKLRSEWVACAVACAYLLNPYVGWMTLDQFHAEAFEVPLVFLSFWFLLRKKWWSFLVTVLLLLLVKEDAALLVVGLGIWVALRYRRSVGLGIAALAALWLFLSFRVVLPLLGGTGSLATYVAAHSVRLPFGGVGGFLRTLVSRPWQVVAAAFGPGRPLYYLEVFGPLAFLPFLSPYTLAAVALPLVFNGLSIIDYQHQLMYHYGTLVVPGLIAAAVWGMEHASVRLRRGLAVALVVSSLLGLWLWGPVPGSRYVGGRAGTPLYAQAAHEAMSLIPPTAAISVDYRFLTHLDHRAEIYEFPNPWCQANWGDYKGNGQPLKERAQRVDYILVLRPEDTQTKETVLGRLMVSGEFCTVFDREGVLLLARRGIDRGLRGQSGAVP